MQRATWTVSAALLATITGAAPGFAQKPGGILKVVHADSPASMSILEEATITAEGPMMAVFNNLVLYDQHVAQNSPDSIVPELATGWSWSEDRTALTFPLRQGVKWHDGKPFTAADVKCTWDMLTGKSNDRLRLNPRKSWYRNLDTVTTAGDYEVTFHLKRPQPSFLALLASGWSPVYPCHVPPAQMRQHPIGTGPFKFVEFKPNESIKLTKNLDYWRADRPYLDGIEYTIIKNLSTMILALGAGQFDRMGPGFIAVPVLKEVKTVAPGLQCDIVPWSSSRTLMINRAVPPFDNIDLRRAMALSLDRKAFVDIISDGQGAISGTMMPPPEGVWGMPPEVLATLPSYGPDVAENRAQARAIMERLGYGPDHRLAVTLSARNVAAYRDPAVIAASQLKEVYIDATLDLVDTAVWYPKVTRKDYTVALSVGENGLDDPDQQFYENYVCGSDRNYTGFCEPQVDALIDKQSAESDTDARRKLVWEIERKLAEDAGRPTIFYPRHVNCYQPYVKGLTAMVNSAYNGWRMEDVWLDK
jgi:peptide/nickel transport system substrate-binding protein